jgi:hypothetical protein
MLDKDKVAAIGVHKKVLMVVVGSREGDAIGAKGELERRRFGTTTSPAQTRLRHLDNTRGTSYCTSSTSRVIFDGAKRGKLASVS